MGIKYAISVALEARESLKIIDDFGKEKFEKFIGSSIEVSQEGEMYNDGQILEWTITLSTKEGHDYTICDAHCAITGWRLRGEVEFN